MKKYTLFSSILSLILLSFLGFNVNSANATNCASGDLFSSVTGQACVTTTGTVTCPTGDLFSSVTGQRCTAWQGNTNSTVPDTLFNRDLTVGSKGGDVKAVQQILKNAGFLTGKVDGSFGPVTQSAVTKYQKENSITVTGTVDSDTFTKIKDIPWYKMCPLINSAYGVSYPCPPVPNTQSPIISGVSGPQSLNVNQQGTWTVTASDSSEGDLSYSVVWGDEGLQVSTNQSYLTIPVQQSATFTHSYSQAGTYTPSFKVANGSGQAATTSLSVNVGNTTSSSITVLSPNGGESWQKGTTQTIKWQDNTPFPVPACPSGAETCPVPARLYDIKLVPYYPPCTGQICPMSAQSSIAYAYHVPYTIATGIYQTSYSWTVGQVASFLGCGAAACNSPVPDGQYTIQICQSGTSTCDSSDSYFTITSGNTTSSSITVLSPNGGESWQKGTTQTIQWKDNTLLPDQPCTTTTTGATACENLIARTYDLKLVPYYPSCTGQTCPMSAQASIAYPYHAPYSIATGVRGSTYSWSVGQVLPTACPTWGCDSPTVTAPDGSYTIQICQSGTNTCDSSDSYFTVTSGSNPPITQSSITVLSPLAGDNIPSGTKMISWRTDNISPSANIVIDLLQVSGDSYLPVSGVNRTNTTNMGSYSFTMPNISGSNYVIGVGYLLPSGTMATYSYSGQFTIFPLI